jgi:DedD protein
MDTRVKERLVGAIALVVIVVLVVPALLTGPRSHAPASGETPNSNRTVVVDLTQNEPGAPSPAAAPAAAPVVMAPPAAVPAPTPSPAAESSAPAAEAPPATPPPLASAPAPKLAEAAPARAEPARKAEATRTETPAPAKAAPPPAPAPAAEPPPDARAAAKSVPHPPKAAAAEGWVVQLGSFASRDNGEKLATTLRAKGYRAFVSEFRGSGRVLFRVRVGPEQDRSRAEAIAARLGHDGYKGSVAPR